MTLAIVARLDGIRPHPDGDRIEVIHVTYPHLRYGEPTGYQVGVDLVVGKHYRAGDLGVWLRPGAVIPGTLARQLWLVGKKRSAEPFAVRDIPIRGVPSPGLWAGRWYRNDSSRESQLRADDMRRGGGREVDGWIEWARWDDAWAPGDDVAEALGIVDGTAQDGDL